MVKLPIIVFHSGRWDESHCYVDHKVLGILVDEEMNFESFISLILVDLGIDVPHSLVHLSVALDFGVSIQKFMEINDDKGVLWFLTFVKGDSTKCPLICHVVDCSLDLSCEQHASSCSSSSIGEKENDLKVIRDVDIDKIGFDFNFKDKDLFESKKVFLKAFSLLTVKGNYVFKTMRSSRTSVLLRCVDDSCPWYVRGSCYKSLELWMLRKYVAIHSCSTDVIKSSHRQVSASIITDCLKERFRFNSSTNTRPHDIMHHMRIEHGVIINYQKAWRAKEGVSKALRGTAEDSYAFIPGFFSKLKEMNPGSYTSFEIDSSGRFKYAFMAIGSSIEGWRHCRPTISVDGTFLTCKFVGTLLTACTLDSNNQIFPLGFGVVDSENDGSWEWFFMNLKESFGDREGLVIISDRHASIPKGVYKAFPDAEHGICIRHLFKNMKPTFKDPLIETLFFKCAKAYTVSEFEESMCLMEALYPSIREYLSNVGFEKWARAYFKRRRYSLMTTNISESLNSSLIDPRDMPVASLFEAIRDLLQKWFYERSKSATHMKTELTTWAESELRKEFEESRNLMVYPSCGGVYQVVDRGVHFTLNVNFWSCTCRVWDLDGIPCRHACAIFRVSNLSAYFYVAKFYFRSSLLSTYNGVVYPIGSRSDWSNVDEDSHVLPPIVKRGAGRPRKLRIRSIDELKNRLRCSRCKRFGHNRKTCKFPI